MRRAPARLAFWLGAGLIVHTVAGLPAALAVRAAVRPCTVTTGPAGPPPRVSVILAAHDEAAVIDAKVRNTFALDHPADRLDLVLVCDGCTDDTAARAQRAMAAGDGRLTVIEVPRGGKNAALRAGIAAAAGEVFLFTDADAMLGHDALARLLAPLADPEVGGAAGRVRFAVDGRASGEHDYWAAEDLLRRLQTRAGSLTSAAGPIYAIRRELAFPPPDGVTDDFWISVQVPLTGLRLVFVPDAVAALPPPPGLRQEFRRKVRIMCAGLRGVWLLRGRYRGRFIDAQIITHKALRRLLIVPAGLMWVASLALGGRGRAYTGVAVAGGLGLLGAVASLAVGGTAWGRRRPMAAARHIAITLAASVMALVELVRGARNDTWGGGGG